MKILTRLAILLLYSVIIAAEDGPLLPGDEIPALRSLKADIARAHLQSIKEEGKLTELVILLQGILEFPDADRAVADDHRVRSARTVASEHLIALGDEGRKIYQRTFNPRAEVLLRRYGKTRDFELLKRLVRIYPLASQCPEALWILARHEMDRALFDSACDHLEKLADYDGAELERIELRPAMLCTAQIKAGRLKDAAATLQTVSIQSLAETLQQQLAAAEAARSRPPQLRLASKRLTTVWKRKLLPEWMVNFWPDWNLSLVDNPFGQKEHGRMFVDGVVFDDGKLYHSLGIWSSCLDLKTGLPLWQRTWLTANQDSIPAFANRNVPRNQVPRAAGMVLFRNHAGTELVLRDKRLFSLHKTFYCLSEPSWDFHGNLLASIDSSTGNRIWQIGRNEEMPLPTSVYLTYSIPAHETPVTIDGNADDWEPDNSLRFQADESSIAYVSTSEKGLLLCLQIADDSPVSYKPGAGDSARVRVTMDNPPFYDKFVFRICITKDGPVVESEDERHSSRVVWKHFPLTARFGLKRDADSYVLEGVLPWSCFGARGKTKEGFSLSLSVKDRPETGRSVFKKLNFVRKERKMFRLVPELRFGPIKPGRGRWQINGVQFLSGPIPYRNRFLLPHFWGGQSGLAAIDADTGRLLWRAEFAAHRHTRNEAPPAAALAIDHGRVFTLLGKGLVAANHVDNGDLLWAIAYPQAKPADAWPRLRQPTDESPLLPRMGWQRNRLIVHGNILIAFPVDSDRILALDARSGLFRYELAKEQLTYVLGRSGNRVFVAGGREIRCLDAATGKWMWQRELQNSQGMGVLLQSRILVPENDHLLLLDQKSGEILERVEVDGFFEHPITNLSIHRGDIYVAGAGNLAKLSEAARLKDDRNPYHLLATKRYSEAARRLIERAATISDEAFPTLVGDLLNTLRCVENEKPALAKLIAEQERLRSHLELRLVCIDLLRDGGRKEEAIRAALDLATADSFTMVRSPSDTQYRLFRSSREWARRKLKAMASDDVKKAVYQEYVQTALGSDAGPVALMRLAAALPNGEQRQSVRKLAASRFAESGLPGLAQRLREGPKQPVPLRQFPKELELVGLFQGKNVRPLGTAMIHDYSGNRGICYDYRLGTEPWTFDPGLTDNGFQKRFRVFKAGGAQMIDCQGELGMHDMQTGERAWVTDTDAIGMQPAEQSISFRDVVPVGDALRCAIGLADRRGLTVVDAYTGELIWAVLVPATPSYVTSSDTRMLLLTKDRTGTTFTLFDSTGEIMRAHHEPDFFPTTSRFLKDAFLARDEGRVIILDLQAFKQTMELQLPQRPEWLSVVEGRNLLIWQRRGKRTMQVQHVLTGETTHFNIEATAQMGSFTWQNTRDERYLIGRGHISRDEQEFIACDLETRSVISQLRITGSDPQHQAYWSRGTKILTSVDLRTWKKQGVVVFGFVDIQSGEPREEMLTIAEQPVQGGRKRQTQIRAFGRSIMVDNRSTIVKLEVVAE